MASYGSLKKNKKRKKKILFPKKERLGYAYSTGRAHSVSPGYYGTLNEKCGGLW